MIRTDASQLKFGYLDDAPVIFTESRAWHFMGGRWQALHIADARCKARLLTQEEFEAYAPIAAASRPTL